MEGRRRASGVLPEPGGPLSNTLWPPAAATSRARLVLLAADLGKVGLVLDGGIKEGVQTGGKRGQPAIPFEEVNGLGQGADSVDQGAGGQGGLGGIGLGEDHAVGAARPQAQGGGEGAVDRAQGSIEGQLAQ